MTASPGADERRIRHLLHTRGVAYTPGATMSEPITPTRVIPAAELRPRPPAPSDIPPWRFPPPAVPPPPPPPAPAVVPPPAQPEQVIRHVHEVLLVPTEPPPPPTWWDRARGAMRHVGRPWQLVAALVLAVAPILPHRYSLAVTWLYCVHQMRLDHGQGAGYALGAGALAAAAWLVYRHGTIPRITALAITLVGLLGAADLFDPITWITGVSR